MAMRRASRGTENRGVIAQRVHWRRKVGIPFLDGGSSGQYTHATRHVPEGASRDACQAHASVGRAVGWPRAECGVSVRLVRPHATTNVGVTIGRPSLAAGCCPLQLKRTYERQVPTASIDVVCLVLARSTYVPLCRFSTLYEVQPLRAISNTSCASRS